MRCKHLHMLNHMIFFTRHDFLCRSRVVVVVYGRYSVQWLARVQISETSLNPGAVPNPRQLIVAKVGEQPSAQRASVLGTLREGFESAERLEIPKRVCGRGAGDERGLEGLMFRAMLARSGDPALVTTPHF